MSDNNADKKPLKSSKKPVSLKERWANDEPQFNIIDGAKNQETKKENK